MKPDNTTPHFEMAGGELCVNALRAAAILATGIPREDRRVTMTVSGLKSPVECLVVPLGKIRDDMKYYVTASFSGMIREIKVTEYDGIRAKIVDLGGIVHVIVPAPFPKDYESAHGKICEAFGLSGREAVGVVWIEEMGDAIAIHPVVWVRDADTFFYETSCGSGSIAAVVATLSTDGSKDVIQPTGLRMTVTMRDGIIQLSSDVEVLGYEFGS
ncbi:MAG: hypothetical protein IPJ67_01485 [Candidatus Moraniibacteriota bacterium]|nr:MAG: hypothetical protein IPJ67_01485 [Candidatus Moranbacteria bacterium]